MPNKNDLTIIVMGLDKDGAPRAGAYPGSAKATATADAKKWGLGLFIGEDDASMKLAKDLPTGLAHNSSKVELPVIKRDLYDTLLKSLKCEVEAAPIKAEEKRVPRTISPWESDIAVGSTVLAQDKDDSGKGYYFAVVTRISGDGKTLTCTWKGFPDLPHFSVRRLAVGLVAMVK